MLLHWRSCIWIWCCCTVYARIKRADSIGWFSRWNVNVTTTTFTNRVQSWINSPRPYDRNWRCAITNIVVTHLWWRCTKQSMCDFIVDAEYFHSHSIAGHTEVSEIRCWLGNWSKFNLQLQYYAEETIEYSANIFQAIKLEFDHISDKLCGHLSSKFHFM